MSLPYTCNFSDSSLTASLTVTDSGFSLSKLKLNISNTPDSKYLIGCGVHLSINTYSVSPVPNSTYIGYTRASMSIDGSSVTATLYAEVDFDTSSSNACTIRLWVFNGQISKTSHTISISASSLTFTCGRYYVASGSSNIYLNATVPSGDYCDNTAYIETYSGDVEYVILGGYVSWWPHDAYLVSYGSSVLDAINNIDGAISNTSGRELYGYFDSNEKQITSNTVFDSSFGCSQIYAYWKPKIRNLLYNNNSPETINFNGNQVSKVVYNGTTVWEA